MEISRHKSTPDHKSLGRALAILDLLKVGPAALSHISQQVGMVPSGVLKVVRTYMTAGLVRQNSDGRYALACGCCGLGQAYMQQNPLRQIALPVMQYLSQRTGAIIVLASMENYEQVNLLCVDSSIPTSDYLPERVGAAWPQATGQVLLAYASSQVRQTHLEMYPPALERLGIVDGTFDDVLAEIRRRGYAIVPAPERSVCYIAAPIMDPFSQVVAATGLAVPLSVTTDESIQHIVHAARTISQKWQNP